MNIYEARQEVARGKIIDAFNLIKRGFDNGKVTSEKYLEYANKYNKLVQGKSQKK